MAQDYASKNRSARSGAKASSRSSRASSPTSPGKWFSAGLLCGVALSVVAWLATQPSEAPPPVAGANGGAARTQAEEPPKPRFDFYTLLPEQQVKFETAATQNANVPDADTLSSDQYLLQAGSFKQAADADRRRGELILLGLAARVEEAIGDNGRWFRVYIGPFETRSRMARARSLTAQQGIDTLLMKRPRQRPPQQPRQG